MKIREYQAGDVEHVVALWNLCELTVPWNDPYKDIERKMKVDPDLFLVGEVDGNIVGTVMGGYEGHRGWINYLGVHPNYRRKGFAAELMNAVEMRIKDKGCPKINLQVRETNTAVIKFYDSIGYGNDNVIGLGKRLVNDEA